LEKVLKKQSPETLAKNALLIILTKEQLFTIQKEQKLSAELIQFSYSL
jgi:hypothetical protein